MKLISMHVDGFGSLHNYNYNFEDGLNIVLHDNGWGKTTMAAFLKAMLYGLDSKRSKDVTENERMRYLPWQGGKCGGSLDFEAEGVKYRIFRTFGETPRYDSAKIINLDSGVTARIDPDKIGETLFKLDASAFQRSVFINQNGLSINGAASSIHTRLNALVSQANDVAAFDDAIKKLTEQIKVYEKTGARGRIGEITREIYSLERQRDKLEADIAQQDSARERISQIDVLIGAIDKELQEKKKTLDEVYGEAKKREASKKLLDDLNKQIEELQQQMDAIRTDLGGHIPGPAEIEQVKRQKQSAATIALQLTELGESYEKISADYENLLEKYNNELPTTSDLDKIQSIYGELQGIRSSKTEAADSLEEEPEGYRLIKEIADEAPDYIGRLQITVGNQETLQQLIRKLEAADRELKSAQDSWKEKKKRYNGYVEDAARLQAEVDEKKLYAAEAVDPVIAGLESLQRKEVAASQQITEQEKAINREKNDWADKKSRYASAKAEIDALQPEADRRSQYAPEKVQPAIETLEGLQTQQQLVDVRAEELSGDALTAEQEALLAANAGDLPDTAEGSEILRKLRGVAQKASDVQGLEARKTGEQSKIDSLQVSVDQLNAILDTGADAVEEPKKSYGTAMIGVGAVVAVIGAVLIFAVTPVMAVAAAVGVVLAVLGVVNNNSYKTRLQAYESYKATASQRQESQKKKEDLQAQLDAAKAAAADLQKKIDSLNRDIQEEYGDVESWAVKWMPGQPITESSVSETIEKAEQVAKLRRKKQDTAGKAEFVTEKTAYIRSERQKIDTVFPEAAGKSIADALNYLRSAETDYKLYAGRLDTAKKNMEKFLAETGMTAEQLSADESPLLANMRAKSDQANAELEGCAAQRKVYDEAYPKIAGVSYEDALRILRSKAGGYNVAAGQLQTAKRNLQKFIDESELSENQLAADEDPNLAALVSRRDDASRELARSMEIANEVLKPLDLDSDPARILQAVREAEQMLNEFKQYSDKLKGRADRQAQKQRQIEELQKTLEDKLDVLQGRYADIDVPERLKLVRDDVISAASLKAKIEDFENDRKKLAEKHNAAVSAVETFQAEFGKFAPETGDILDEIYAKASKYAELAASVRQLEKRKTDADPAQNGAQTGPSTEEAALREEIARLERRRDVLRDEYTQRSDSIRQADQSLERYPDVIQEIHDLYDQKQKAQNTVTMLKRTIQLITKAKENLANRYLSKVEQMFNNYMHIWLNNDAVRGILDIDFNIAIEENEKTHVAQGYSTGYCDLIDFCMRLALVDTLFEKEQPFLIMDDPFVNLDADRLDKALELLNVMAASKQIIYFVCHPIRAVEADENTASRAEFVRLAEAARKTIEDRRASGTERKQTVRKSPKEMYKVVNPRGTVAIKPARPNYTITNNIFSMNFVLNEVNTRKDYSYELFFIDAVGHVLNDRQLIEIRDGKLSTERVQFCLNTRDDSGEQYELMIRESGQDDYEVAARIPFRAKLAFAGTSSFDF